MHRRDYILIADTLASFIKKAKSEIANGSVGGILNDGTPDALVDEFCDTLQKDNANFNDEKFREYIRKRL